MNSPEYLILSDEPIYHGTNLEWWYFHGFFSENNGLGTSFILSVFRSCIKPELLGAKHGYSLLLSLFDHSSGKTDFISQINKDIFYDFVNSDDINIFGRNSNGLLKLLQEAYKENGPPEPIVVSDEEIVISRNPFTIHWGKTYFRKEKNGFIVRFVHPETNIKHKLKLVPEQEGFRYNSTVGDHMSKGMEYFFNPRMKIAGTKGEKFVSGQGWVDHQWGDFSWIVKDGGILLGWIWFGINLENDLVIMIGVRREIKTNRTLSKLIHFSDGNQSTKILNELDIKVTRHWESPNTMIQYPVEIEIMLPEIEASLNFQPYSDDQEIPFFGPMRAIWQGAGSVIGTIANKSISGTARLELNGYGYITELL